MCFDPGRKIKEPQYIAMWYPEYDDGSGMCSALGKSPDEAVQECLKTPSGYNRNWGTPEPTKDNPILVYLIVGNYYDGVIHGQ